MAQQRGRRVASRLKGNPRSTRLPLGDVDLMFSAPRCPRPTHIREGPLGHAPIAMLHRCTGRSRSRLAKPAEQATPVTDQASVYELDPQDRSRARPAAK